ncbi:ABC transporter permease [Methylocapsa palsarum]|uniref:Oligopeptide transport system permease protein n=1 Tax=Methylocapsa palsarum TaxID=1612308 RepID=A0A1I3XJZ6_9HYPH|nr:ABC transporter permease subunit [Methylocapsa palsarum]SFK19800.1 oligopeptide transport system permease protein [Methylocapsa palsarum]
MLRLALSRAAAAAPVLFIIVLLTFLLMRLAPGGPFDAERTLDPQIEANLRRIYRLDLPLTQQFWLYLVHLVQGDFGPSFHWRDFSVNELLAKALPISMRLGAEAMIIALTVGSALGIAGASSPRGIGARLVDGVALFGLAIPPLVVAPLLQLGFGLGLHALPVGGWNGGAWRNQVLPAMTLALPLTAAVARLTQAALSDVLSMPHIRTLRGFGFPSWRIYAHALRSALLPVLSYLGLAAANILTGSIIIETIFGIPGMGRYFIDGALGRDYTLVMATVIIVAALVLLFNLLVDLTYAWLDPRVRDG